MAFAPVARRAAAPPGSDASKSMNTAPKRRASAKPSISPRLLRLSMMARGPGPLLAATSAPTSPIMHHHRHNRPILSPSLPISPFLAASRPFSPRTVSPYRHPSASPSLSPPLLPVTFPSKYLPVHGGQPPASHRTPISSPYPSSPRQAPAFSYTTTNGMLRVGIPMPWPDTGQLESGGPQRGDRNIWKGKEGAQANGVYKKAPGYASRVRGLNSQQLAKQRPRRDSGTDSSDPFSPSPTQLRNLPLPSTSADAGRNSAGTSQGRPPRRVDGTDTKNPRTARTDTPARIRSAPCRGVMPLMKTALFGSIGPRIFSPRAFSDSATSSPSYLGRPRATSQPITAPSCDTSPPKHSDDSPCRRSATPDGDVRNGSASTTETEANVTNTYRSLITDAYKRAPRVTISVVSNSNTSSPCRESTTRPKDATPNGAKPNGVAKGSVCVSGGAAPMLRGGFTRKTPERGDCSLHPKSVEKMENSSLNSVDESDRCEQPAHTHAYGEREKKSREECMARRSRDSLGDVAKNQESNVAASSWETPGDQLINVNLIDDSSAGSLGDRVDVGSMNEMVYQAIQSEPGSPIYASSPDKPESPRWALHIQKFTALTSELENKKLELEEEREVRRRMEETVEERLDALEKLLNDNVERKVMASSLEDRIERLNTEAMEVQEQAAEVQISRQSALKNAEVRLLAAFEGLGAEQANAEISANEHAIFTKHIKVTEEKLALFIAAKRARSEEHVQLVTEEARAAERLDIEEADACRVAGREEADARGRIAVAQVRLVDSEDQMARFESERASAARHLEDLTSEMSACDTRYRAEEAELTSLHEQIRLTREEIATQQEAHNAYANSDDSSSSEGGNSVHSSRISPRASRVGLSMMTDKIRAKEAKLTRLRNDREYRSSVAAYFTQMDQEISELNQEAKSHSSRLQEATCCLDECNTERTNLEQQVTAVNDEGDGTQMRLRALRAELAARQMENRDHKAEIAEFERVFAREREITHEHAVDLAECDAEIHRCTLLSDTLEQSRMDHARLENIVEAKQLEADAVREKLASWELESAKAQNDVDEMRARLAEEMRKHEACTGEVTRVQAVLYDALEESARLQADIDAHRSSLVLEQATKEELTATLEDVVMELRAAQDKEESLKKQFDAVSTHVAEVKNNVADTQNALADLTSQMAAKHDSARELTLMKQSMFDDPQDSVHAFAECCTHSNAFRISVDGIRRVVANVTAAGSEVATLRHTLTDEEESLQCLEQERIHRVNAARTIVEFNDAFEAQLCGHRASVVTVLPLQHLKDAKDDRGTELPALKKELVRVRRGSADDETLEGARDSTVVDDEFADVVRDKEEKLEVLQKNRWGRENIMPRLKDLSSIMEEEERLQADLPSEEELEQQLLDAEVTCFEISCQKSHALHHEALALVEELKSALRETRKQFWSVLGSPCETTHQATMRELVEQNVRQREIIQRLESLIKKQELYRSFLFTPPSQLSVRDSNMELSPAERSSTSPAEKCTAEKGKVEGLGISGPEEERTEVPAERGRTRYCAVFDMFFGHPGFLDTM
eukprot:GEMP01001675.1.p1 GENE.GEMP01001675.1~~GEMP01001675.1.p1  ORF type:complete len:1554 (+),score=472.07 GEMP01001675.1:127-4788(+)